MKTTVERVRSGVQKLPLGGCAMAYENHRGASTRWCTKIAIEQGHDGVRKPPLGGCVIVYKNCREMGVRWCTKTIVG
jgi:hypothetical protein